MTQNIFLAGINHNSASQDLREKFALPLGVKELLVAAKKTLGASEMALISTCNRQEIILVCEPNSILSKAKDCALEHIVAFWAQAIGQNKDELKKYAYCYNDKAAVNHLFQVAASLDSMLQGEPQILGQVKKAYAHAVKEGTSKVILNKLFHKSFYTAKRVFSHTQIGVSPVSVVFAALDLLKSKLTLLNPSSREHELLQDKKILILGAGETAELACKYLQDAGAKNIIIANRTLANAQKLVNQLAMHPGQCAGQACTLGEVEQVLPSVDIVLGTATLNKPLISTHMLFNALSFCNNLPFFIIDIALPRNIDPCLRGLAGVEFYDLDDLQELVEKSKQNRQEEARKALPIIEQEVDSFMLWLNSLALEPTIVDLLKRTQAIADAELAKTLKKIGPLDVQTVNALEAMLNAVVKKINHEPITFIKRVQQKHGNISRYIDILRSFFALDEKK